MASFSIILFYSDMVIDYPRLSCNFVSNSNFKISNFAQPIYTLWHSKNQYHIMYMALKESISYYVHRQSSAFCYFVDASKAFDRVRYCKLFRFLVSRQVPALIIGVLINFYFGNFVRVQWCGIESDYFLACNGMKQGGVLSPILFCLYIDGCWWHFQGLVLGASW